MRLPNLFQVALGAAGLLVSVVAMPQVPFEQGNFFRIAGLQIPDCEECKGQVNLSIENLKEQNDELTFEIWIASDPASGFSAISYSLVFSSGFSSAEVEDCTHVLNERFSSDYDSTISHTRFSASAASESDLPGFSVHVLHQGAFNPNAPVPSTLTSVPLQLGQLTCPRQEDIREPQIALYPYPNYTQSFYSMKNLADDAGNAVRYAQRAAGEAGGNLQVRQGDSNVQLRESDTQGVLLDDEILISTSEPGERVRSISLKANYTVSGQLYWRGSDDEDFKLLVEGSIQIAEEMGVNEATAFLRGLRVATGNSFPPTEANISLELESTLGSQTPDSLVLYQVSVVHDGPVTLSTPTGLLTAKFFQLLKNLGLITAASSDDEVMNAVAEFCSQGVQTGVAGFYADSDGDAVPNNVEARTGTNCRDSGSNDLVGGISVRPAITFTDPNAESKISAFASQPASIEQLGVSCPACVELTAYVKESSGPCSGETLPGNYESVCRLAYEAQGGASFQPGLSTLFWLGVDQHGNWALNGSRLAEQSVYLAPQINFGDDIVLSLNAAESGTLITFLDVSGADVQSLRERSAEFYLSTTKPITILEDGVEMILDGIRLPLTQKLSFQFTYENLIPGGRKTLRLQCSDGGLFAEPGEKRFIDKGGSAPDSFFATCGKDTLYITRGDQVLPPRVRFDVYEQDSPATASEVLVFRAGASIRIRIQAAGYSYDDLPKICSVSAAYAPLEQPFEPAEGTSCANGGNLGEVRFSLPQAYVDGNVLRLIAEVEGRWSGDDSITRNWWGVSVPVLASAPLGSIPGVLNLIATNGNAFAEIEVLPGFLLLRSTDRSTEAAELARLGVLSTPYVSASGRPPPFGSSPLSTARMFDFRIRVVSPALQTPNFARIRLPLGVPAIAGDRVARYNFATNKWELFSRSREEDYYSAPEPCPGVVADSQVPEPWKRDLNEGDDCLLLHIVDDGENDADPAPGSIAALVTVGSGSGDESAAGTRNDLGGLLIAALGLLVFAGAYDPLALLGLILVICLAVFQRNANHGFNNREKTRNTRKSFIS